MKRFSVYLAYLLRHDPGRLSLTMDSHGWVAVEELLEKLRAEGRFPVTRKALEQTVRTDSKGRFRFSGDLSRIRACQGHSIPWVEPELAFREPPALLYHGTTLEAWEKIRQSGYISRMGRHAVHMRAEEEKAWQSARRWRRTPVVLQIDAAAMYAEGVAFGISDNGVWCADHVPVERILAVIYEKKE